MSVWTKLDPNNMETWPDKERIIAESNDGDIWFQGNEYLFQWKNGKMCVGCLYGDTEDWFKDGVPLKVEPTCGDWTYAMEDFVAWMPLPEPYKGEDQ